MPFFTRILPSRTFLAQASSAGVLSAMSDILCQKLVNNAEEYNPIRTLRFSFVTSCFVVPIQFQWFRFLEKLFTDKSFKNVVKKLLVDQAIMAPILTAWFIFTFNLINLQSIGSAWKGLESVYLDVLSTNYKVWPTVQLINFAIVPLNYRVIFIQFVALFWNIYLSHKLID